MRDIHELPIPDWGLHCAHCDAPLAGLTGYRCAGCGQPFNILHRLGKHRPIPELDLECPECDYPLTGLTGEICPECGESFDLIGLLESEAPLVEPADTNLADPADHHIARRPPHYTGQERPLPDFGLLCSSCDAPLAGMERDRCPACAQAVDLAGLLPDRDWVSIKPFVPANLMAIYRVVLYEHGVPYVMDNERLRAVMGDSMRGIMREVRVPREYFFDALAALAEAQAPPPVSVDQEWQCPACGELVPGGFELCWSCGGAHPGLNPPD